MIFVVFFLGRGILSCVTIFDEPDREHFGEPISWPGENDHFYRC